MPEFERNLNNNEPRDTEVRIVSDAERARRGYSEFNHPGEIVDHGGSFNALDGTHPYTQEDADIADRAYLAQQGGQRGHEPLTSRAVRAVRRAIDSLR